MPTAFHRPWRVWKFGCLEVLQPSYAAIPILDFVEVEWQLCFLVESHFTSFIPQTLAPGHSGAPLYVIFLSGANSQSFCRSIDPSKIGFRTKVGRASLRLLLCMVRQLGLSSQDVGTASMTDTTLMVQKSGEKTTCDV